MQDQMTEAIIEYAEEENASTQFAISLYGEWGSGKTHYCENVLDPALKNKGICMLRVSLFGVSTYEELYNRMLSALCHVDGARTEKIAKTVGKGLLSILDGYLGDKGIKLDVNAETVVSAMPMEKTLIVLDDSERSKFPRGMDDLLGLVNDMVENHRWHIMLVRNKPFDLASNEAEKVVSRQFEYLPMAEDLYEAVVTPGSIAKESDFDIKDAIVSGMKSSGKLNARALARIMPTVRLVASSQTMHSQKIAPEGRSRAFTDVVRFSLAMAAGEPPSKPAEKEKKYPFDMNFALASMQWDRYKLLADIVDPIGCGKLASRETIEGCLAGYIEKECPGSPADMEIKAIYDSLGQIGTMDDPDVSKMASELTATIRRHEFSPAWLYRAWTTNRTFRGLGFDEALGPADVKACYGAKARENPVLFYAQLHEEYSSWVGAEGTSYDADLEEVIAYSKSLIERSMRGAEGAYDIESIDEYSGAWLAEEMEASLNGPLPAISLISPRYVSESFFCGNGDSQDQLHRFFRSILGMRFGRIQDQEALLNWLRQIKDELEKKDAGSRMACLRQSWLISDIVDVCKSINNFRKDSHRKEREEGSSPKQPK